MDDILNGLQLSPLTDAERIFALPDRAARESALLALTQDRRDMVSHFLVLKFAKALCEALPNGGQKGGQDALLAQIPAHLVVDVKLLARSYIEAACMVAGSKR